MHSHTHKQALRHVRLKGHPLGVCQELEGGQSVRRACRRRLDCTSTTNRETFLHCVTLRDCVWNGFSKRLSRLPFLSSCDSLELLISHELTSPARPHFGRLLKACGWCDLNTVELGTGTLTHSITNEGRHGLRFSEVRELVGVRELSTLVDIHHRRTCRTLLSCNRDINRRLRDRLTWLRDTLGHRRCFGLSHGSRVGSYLLPLNAKLLRSGIRQTMVCTKFSNRSRESLLRERPTQHDHLLKACDGSLHVRREIDVA